MKRKLWATMREETLKHRNGVRDMATWEHTDLNIDGRLVKVQAPIIVLASRSTDIPAFYADWFFKRLEIGFSAWTNPFKGVKYYISYDKTRFIVFWSKNPRPLLDKLHLLRERNIKCYVQYTLNDYENEKLEKVPALEYRIETFKLLVERLGKGAVVWRVDPMILTDDISVDDLLKKVLHIGDQLKGFTEKLVFSYADIAIYKKVKANLERAGIPYHEWTEEQMEIFAQRLSSMNKERGWNYALATCGEKIDLEKYGIEHNRCIDGDLMARIAWEDKALMDFMGIKMGTLPEPTLFGDAEIPQGAVMLPGNRYFISAHKKDKGQRELCGCMAAKDIGEYNTCPHLCEYCYANTSKQSAMLNYKCHTENPWGETITGR